MRMKHAIKVAIFCWIPMFSLAQLPLSEKGEGLMRREVYGGLTLATNGWGFNFNYAKQKNYRYKHVFGFHIGNIRHEKETKSYTSIFDDSKGYYYGKLNSVVSFRPFYGGKRVLFENRRNQGVEINFVWSAGLSIALINPVYLKIKVFDNQAGGFVNEEHRFDPQVHHTENIYGKSNWFKGFGESRLPLGIFTKYSFFFDLSAKKLNIWGVELGTQLEVFYERLPIVHNAKNHFAYPALFANIQFGRKLM